VKVEPSAKRVAALAGPIAAVVVVTSLTLRLFFVNGYLQDNPTLVNEMLNVDAEGNAPTWFASMLLFSCALTAFAIHLRVDETKAQRAWLGFSGLAAFVSVDEAASLHEQLGQPVRDLLGTSGLLYFSWVLVAIPAIVFFAIALRPVLGPLLRTERSWFLGSLGLLISGAIIGEMFSGLAVEDQESPAYIIITHFEEGLEFAGAVATLYSLLRILTRLSSGQQRRESIMAPSREVPSAS